ncbi:MAG: hypothetical protein MR766_04620 [Erysipelotrichaceae bacterium]|nr:hypothetical protein [Erysipelotrichaceae bacterium]
MKINTFDTLKASAKNPKNSRVFAELELVLEVNKIHNNKFDSLIDSAIDYLSTQYQKNGAIIIDDVYYVEEMLKSLSPLIKQYKVICLGHAHIDVNWMWGIDETVNITMNTWETMLNLMDMYPEFTFAQSQAYLYDLMAKYRPDLIERIKKHIKTGQWELTCSTYVENDRNMISMNSFNKQFEFAKKRIAEIFSLKDSEIDIDFEPDTFGHSAFTPEVLANHNIKYYYHCRGNNEVPIYRWSAPSGKNILVYREPRWYLGEIEDTDFDYVPSFCHENNINYALKVYGCGDHGGGATVRDIERLKDMQKWPLMVDIKFGTLHKFFKEIEKKNDIKQVFNEQNSIFTGCYSSCYEIKAMNANFERSLHNAEIFTSLDKSKKYNFDEALTCYLPSHFHDVITGSTVSKGKDFAMGQFQTGLCNTGTNKQEALRNLAKNIDTTSILPEVTIDKENQAIGAGNGYKISENNFAISQGYGTTRAVAVFNPSNKPRREVVTFEIWDYYGDVRKLGVFDYQGFAIPFSIKEVRPTFYWYHNCHIVSVYAHIPALGHNTYIIRPIEKELGLPHFMVNPRHEQGKDDLVLENEFVKATFDSQTFNLKSYICMGEETLKGESFFELVKEDTTDYMTAWYMGRIKEKETLKNITLIPGSFFKNETCQGFSYTAEVGQSRFRISVSLDRGDLSIKYNVHLFFKEEGSYPGGIPQIRYYLNTIDSDKVTCDVPGGFIERTKQNMPQPCVSLMTTSKVGLFASGMHAFRFDDNGIYLTLIRNSVDPYFNPELGDHDFTFRVFANKDLHYQWESYTNNLETITLNRQKGELLPLHQYFQVDDRLILQSISNGEVVVTSISDKDEEYLINEKPYIIKAKETKSIKYE